MPESEVMPMYQERLAQIETAIREHHIVTLPARAASIRLATRRRTPSSRRRTWTRRG